MSNEIKLSDEALEGFSQPAKERLRAATIEYLEELISECYRLEGSMNSDDGPAEITQGMVNDAVIFKKKDPSKEKRKILEGVRANCSFYFTTTCRILL